MKEQLEKLKAELREFIELSKTVTPAKWATGDKGDMVYRQPGEFCQAAGIIIDGRSSGISREQDQRDATFIARSRNISPAMAEGLLVAVEGLEYVISCYDAARFEGLNERLQESEYGVGTLRDLVERRLYYSESEAMEKLDQIINLWNLK